MINLLKNQRGFGMLQAMIFAGIIAAGALVATRVINDLKLTQRGAATKDELEILHRSVQAALQDSTNCTATRRGLLDGLAPSRVILADSANSTGQLADNPVIIQVGNVYGGNSVKVDSIAVNSANASWAASPDQQVVVTYSRLKSDEANRLGQGYGGKEVRRVIPISMIWGTPAEERCYADPKTGGNYYSSGSTQKFCQSLGSFMVWDSSNRKCIRNNHVCPADHAFTGVDSNGAVICQRLSAAMNAGNLFDTTAPTSCPGRTQLQLVVVGGKIRIQCIASGTANLAWTPLTHDFGAVAIPGPSASQVFTLTNSGSAATAGCSAPTISDTTNFTLAPSGNCVGSNNLPAGTNCTVSVSAIPQTAGSKTATLSRTCTTGGTAVTTTNMIVVEAQNSACSDLPALMAADPEDNYTNSSTSPAIYSSCSCVMDRFATTTLCATTGSCPPTLMGAYNFGFDYQGPQGTCSLGQSTCNYAVWLPSSCTPTSCTPVNGGWSAWTICSTGTQSRTCDNPAPSCGGTSCSGFPSRSCTVPLANGTYCHTNLSCPISNMCDECLNPPLNTCGSAGWGKCGQTSNCSTDPNLDCGMSGTLPDGTYCDTDGGSCAGNSCSDCINAPLTNCPSYGVGRCGQSQSCPAACI